MSWYICCFVSPNSACWHFSCVRLFATLRTIARWSPLSMGFFRQEHWNGLLCPPPGNLPNPGIKPASLPFPSLADWLFTINATWEALVNLKESSFLVLSSVQLFTHVQLSATPWTAACQAYLSITNRWSLWKLMSIESVMPSNHLIFCHPLLLLPQSFPASGSFSVSQFFTSGGQSIGVSVSTSVFPMNTRDWFPLGLTGWISLQSKGLSRVFSNTTVQKHQFFDTQLLL